MTVPLKVVPFLSVNATFVSGGNAAPGKLAVTVVKGVLLFELRGIWVPNRMCYVWVLCDIYGYLLGWSLIFFLGYGVWVISCGRCSDLGSCYFFIEKQQKLDAFTLPRGRLGACCLTILILL